MIENDFLNQKVASSYCSFTSRRERRTRPFSIERVTGNQNILRSFLETMPLVEKTPLLDRRRRFVAEDFFIGVM